MIAFYAWTDTLLMNAIRVKETDYPNESADLFVLLLDRVSEELLQKVEQSDVFSSVIRLQEPTRGLVAPLHKLTKLLTGEQYYLNFAAQLAPVAGQKYRRFLTGGFWSYSLFLFRYFLKSNTALEYCFIEEGTAAYNGLESLLRCDPLSRKRSELYRFFFYRRIFPEARSRLRMIYLYSPEALLRGEGLERREIRRFSPKAEALLSDYTSKFCPEQYQGRDVVIFLQPESDVDLKITLANINAAAKLFGPERVAVKTHPAYMNDAWLSGCLEGVFIERDRFSFDLIVDKIDWTDKLLIAKGTSCVFYPLFMCGQQPHLLFTYDMYSADPERDIPARLAEQVMRMYEDKSRVLIVRSANEYQAKLEEFYNKKIKKVDEREKC